ncbi:MAG: SDR family oxidoreductase [Bacteroidales bacterium]
MNIFLTGSTGFLGGEILVNLSKRPEVKKVFCLIRAKSEDESLFRLKKIFALHKDNFDDKRIIPIIGDLTDPELTKVLSQNKNLRDINIVVHSAANTSFSPIYNEMVEKVNILGLEKVLQWAKNLKNLKTFEYIGTATICGEGVSNRIVFEDESPNLNSKHFVKYTYTKMLGEISIHNNLPENKILIARPSIIMGDTRTWVPRSYVILWALATGNLMRLVPVNPKANLDIVPVDYTARAIVELLFVKRNHSIYHISSGTECMTSPIKLTKTFENNFTDRPPFKFVNIEMIQQMKNWAKGRLQPNNTLFQYPEYLEYWERIFDDKGSLRILFAGLEPYLKFIELGQIFDNTRLLKDTNMGNPEPAHEYIKRSVKYLENIDVFEGALDP